MTRSPSLTFTATTRPATFGARSTSGASMRPLRCDCVGSSVGRARVAQREQGRAIQASSAAAAIEVLTSLVSVSATFSSSMSLVQLSMVMPRSRSSVPVARTSSVSACGSRSAPRSRRAAPARDRSGASARRSWCSGRRSKRSCSARSCVSAAVEPGARRLDAARRGLERGRGVPHFDGDPLLHLGERRSPCGGDRLRAAPSWPRAAPVAERQLERDADRRVGKLLLRERAPASAEAAVERVGNVDGRPPNGTPGALRRRRGRASCSRRPDPGAASAHRWRARRPRRAGDYRGRARRAPGDCAAASASAPRASIGDRRTHPARRAATSSTSHIGSRASSSISCLSARSARATASCARTAIAAAPLDFRRRLREIGGGHRPRLDAHLRVARAAARRAPGCRAGRRGRAAPRRDPSTPSPPPPPSAAPGGRERRSIDRDRAPSRGGLRGRGRWRDSSARAAAGRRQGRWCRRGRKG